MPVRKLRITAALGLVFNAALAAPAFGQSFLGEWTATAVTLGGEISETLTVVKAADGPAVTAKPVTPGPAGAPEAGPGTDIVLDGDNFSYKRTVTFPGGEIVITYKGVVSGDRFTGTAELGGMEVPYNGVRRTAGAPRLTARTCATRAGSRSRAARFG